MNAAIPPWVPFVFFALVALGYRQSRTRTVRPGAVALMALAMLAFSLAGVVGAFGASAVALAGWAAGCAATLAWAAPRFAAGGLSAVADGVRLPGSWVPMALLMGIFATKSVLGAAAGLHAPVLHQAGFVAGLSAVLGALSGGFAARALAVHRCAAQGAARGL